MSNASVKILSINPSLPSKGAIALRRAADVLASVHPRSKVSLSPSCRNTVWAINWWFPTRHVGGKQTLLCLMLRLVGASVFLAPAAWGVSPVFGAFSALLGMAVVMGFGVRAIGLFSAGSAMALLWLGEGAMIPTLYGSALMVEGILLALFGPGRLSIDAWWRRKLVKEARINASLTPAVKLS